jgi:GNAT superfamily N-acetyltransferase
MITPLSSLHKKADFSCGNDLLDRYIRQQAKQDQKRHLSACFVLIDDNLSVKGYYTLSSDSIPRELLPEAIIKKLPSSYTNLPVTLVGRLAIDNVYKGQGLGGLLLLDALKRSYETSISTIGAMAVVVDPIDENARRFYTYHDFITLPDSGKMFIPMTTIAELFP